MSRTRHVGVGRLGSLTLERFLFGAALGAFFLAAMLAVVQGALAPRGATLWASDVSRTLVTLLVGGGICLSLALARGLWSNNRWFAAVLGRMAETPESQRVSAVILDELARALRGRREDSVAVGRIRDRDVRVELDRDGLSRRCYRITLATPLGAPRAGTVTDADRIPQYGETIGEGASPLARSRVANSPQWTALFRVYRVAKVSFEEGSVHATAAFGANVLSPLDEAGRLLRLLERLAVVSDGHRELELKAREGGTGERCPYCHAEFSESGTPEGALETTACRGCGTRYHGECWSELGGCATLGCKARPAVPVRA